MADHIIVVEHASDWKSGFPPGRVVTARDYLGNDEFLKLRKAKVTNLCRSYGYLSVGYYVSLLAEARRHRAVPSIRTLSELSRKSIYSLDVAELDALVHRSLRHSTQNTFDVLLYFGQCEHVELDELARQIYEMFPCPLLRVHFKQQGEKWRITRIRPFWIHALTDLQHAPFVAAVEHHLSKRWRTRRARPESRYDLAILVNPSERLPPSDARALRNFVRVGKSLGLDVELIEKKDYPRLAEYDALFIRETTAVDHYTYRFARKAESEGMVVMDDPDSILKCTNKVYLAELLATSQVPMPKSVILQERDGAGAVERSISYPVVVKIPDGSFSRGVFKVDDRAAFESVAAQLFKESDLILAQEFLYTEFDWRIGVLNGSPIYACQYFMSKKHWQIVEYKGGRVSEGAWRAVAVEDVPAPVLRAAVRAADLIGTGLYGVDVKETGKRVCVIEVNDNPNLEAGVEDGILRDELYRTILEEFIRRLEA
jgi:glutathione synthase/RimK-type ligase-like ATP-grasp enzyme